MSKVLQATVVPPEAANKSENRADWALMFLGGAGMVMTLFSAVVLWIVRDNDMYAFYMGAAAMIQIFVVLTGLMGLLVKRTLKISRGEISFSDFDPDDNDAIPRAAAVKAVEEAVEEIPAVGVPTESKNDTTNKQS